MRLFSKIAVTMAATVIAGTIASATAVAYVFVPQYLEMDRTAALNNAERVYDFLQHELATASSYAGDWGHWDETFEFAKNLDKGFIERNLKQDDLQTIHVDEFVIARRDRTVAFELRADRTPDAAPVPFAGLKTIPAAQWHDFAGKVSRERRVGFASTPAGPAIVAMTAITNSNGNGPSPGVMILARLADAAFLKSVHEQTNLEFSLLPANAASNQARETAKIGRSQDVSVTLAKHDGLIEVGVMLHDVSGVPSFTLRVATPTRYAQMIWAAMWVTLAILLVVGGFVGLVMFAFVQRAVTAPLERMIAHTRHIAETGNLDTPLSLKRTDEIGALANAFDGMIGDLRQARRQLQEQSFVNGMANIAAEMLHNIRNVLSPVSTAIWKGRESLKDVRTDRLRQAGLALAQGDIDAERKAKLADYVGASAQHIFERCQSAQSEFEAIAALTNQIESVLSNHDELSRGVRHAENVAVADIVTDIAAFARQERFQDVELVVMPSVAALPEVTAQRVVLLQVLGNLFLNALQSIGRAQASPGRVVIDGRDLGDQIELTFADNGEGISAERMPQLFKRGFTSRGAKGTGLGLHYSATNLNAMNGSIKAESEGSGKGATFRIRLPVASRKDKVA